MQKKLSPWCKKAKIAMIQNDISVNDLAEELGCSRCYLSSTLNGKNTSIEIRRRISDYLNICGIWKALLQGSRNHIV